MPIRTVIAEDNLLVREGVRGLLSGDEDVELIGVFEDLNGVTAGIEELHPDVVVTDIRQSEAAIDAIIPVGPSSLSAKGGNERVPVN